MKYSEENIFTLLQRIGVCAGSPVFRHGNYSQIQLHNGVWPNICFDLCLDEDLLDLEIAEIQNRIDQNLTPPVFMCCPGKVSDKTLEKLRETASGAAKWAAMTLNLQNWNYAPKDSDIEIVHVRTAAEMQDWCHISNESLVGEAGIDESLFQKLKDDKDFGFFLAVRNGKPVAACMSFKSGGKGGLYLVATLKKWRGFGYGREVTEYAIHHLKLQGVEEIHLQATEDGESVYKRIGFVKYGDVEVFNLRGE